MTQKIHGDLEIVGGLTVGGVPVPGEASGGGLTFLGELEIQSSCLENNITGLGSGSVGHYPAKCGQWWPVKVGTFAEWDDIMGTFTAPDDGHYLFIFPPMILGDISTGLDVRMGTCLVVDYVAYNVILRRDNSNYRHPAFVVTMELSSGDNVLFGTYCAHSMSSTTIHGSPVANHGGLDIAGASATEPSTIKIYKAS
jgi:hypothetical protein